MLVANKRLGDVLAHIYDYPFHSAIYLPEVARYEPDTGCIVAWTGDDEGDCYSQHRHCLSHGFKNWLNVAVVSDVVDEVSEPTEANLIAAFNESCRDGGWLSRNMNFWK